MAKYAVTVLNDKGQPTAQIILGDPKSARIVAEKYQKQGKAIEVKIQR